MEEGNLKNLRFIDEAKLKRAVENLTGDTAQKNVSNPIKSDFLRFIHIKNKFNLKDL